MFDMNRIKDVLEVRGISQTELGGRLDKSFNMVNFCLVNKIQFLLFLSCICNQM